MRPLVKGLAVVLLWGGIVMPARSTALSVGETAPTWELSDLTGELRRLEDWRGTWVLLKLGTTQCQNCSLQLIELGRIADAISLIKISVIDIYLHEDRYTVKQYWRKNQAITYRPTILYDYSSKLVKAYGITLIPQLVLVDPTGLVKWKGSYTPGPELLKILKIQIAGE